MWRFAVLVLIHSASAVFHSMEYFSTGSSGLSNLPEFETVCVIDGVQVFHYDSNTSRAEPKQDWMEKLIADDPDYCSDETEELVSQQFFFKRNIESLRKFFNQSGGVLVLQRTSGCEWDNETGEIDGFMKYAYNGEDLISFDLKTQTWIPLKHETLIIKNEWHNDPAGNIQLHHFLSKECPRRLQRLLSYGRSSLLRTELPSVFLLQKTPSSPITCLATGFHPDRAMLFWRRDGEELHEGMDVEETLPNHDGSFQMRAHLDPPSDDWQRYKCVFSFSSEKDDVVTRLDKAAAGGNSDPVDDNSIIIRDKMPTVTTPSAPSASTDLSTTVVVPAIPILNINIIISSSSSIIVIIIIIIIGCRIYRKKQRGSASAFRCSAKYEAPRSADSEDPRCTINIPQSEGSASASRCSADSEAPRSTVSEAPRPDNEAPLMGGSDPDVEDTD